MKLAGLLLLFATSMVLQAASALAPGSYSGQWMGAPQGYLTGDSVSLTINSDRTAEIYYTQPDPITGNSIPHTVPVRLINSKVMRGRFGASMRGYSQRQGESVRGWFRIQGRKVVFFAHYRGPSTPAE